MPKRNADGLRVSVVVPTRNRAASLRRLLAALDRQSLARETFEVVIVDDASTDDTPRVLSELVEASRGPVQMLRQDAQRGPATARNRGWRAARAAIIAFTDDDCRPEPGWLEAGVAAIAAGAGLAMGKTISDADPSLVAAPFSRAVVIEAENSGYPTCNIFYPRAVLESLGGFDESFRLPFGEDMELAWRAKKAGQRSVFTAASVVIHDTEPPDFRRFLRDRRRWSELVHVTSLHPELRQFFTLGFFVQRSHLYALAALAALLAAPLTSWWLLALPPALWIKRFSELSATRRLGPASIAGWILADLWELALFAAASVRYRTLLL